MKTVIIFNHPYKHSYCNAVLESAINGLRKANHEVDLIHLDEEEFDPVMRAKDLKAFVQAKYESKHHEELLDSKVLEYRNRLMEAEHLVFIFPIWWELMPALMKGFVDKVIFPGIAYEYANNDKKMVPKFKKINGITLITTMNTPSILYRFIFGNAIKKAFFTGTFWKMRYKNRKWIKLTRVKFVSENKRKKWLSDINTYFQNLD
jgi:putative NADPH-quinone reductase